MNDPKHTKAGPRRDNGPASDGDNNRHNNNNNNNTSAHDGAAAEQQPLVKDTKKNNKDKGTKSLCKSGVSGGCSNVEIIAE